MSLETHIAGSEDRLLDSLTFAGKSTASYVTERRNCTFAPQSRGNFPTSPTSEVQPGRPTGVAGRRDAPPGLLADQQ